jgi:hypothetical protein
MRNFGLVLLILGIAGFFYFSEQLGKVEPLPTGEALTVRESLRYPAGKLAAAKDGSAAAGLLGIILILLPVKR